MYCEKVLHTVSPKDLVYFKDKVKLHVVGIFDTTVPKWTYYVCSVDEKQEYLTPHLTSSRCSYDMDNITGRCKSYKTLDEAIAYIENFKDMWESGLNDPRSVIRDRKLGDLLEEDDN